MRDFHNCIDFCELIQAPKSGLEFSWCNDRLGTKRILCNLDKAFFNLKWLETFNGWHYKVGARGISDHGPLVGSDTVIPRALNISFRFQKMWLSHPSFMQVIFDSWSEEISVTARGEYDIAANNYHTFLRDKARINWIKEGYINSKFFHTSIKLRQRKNSIAELEDSSGNIITDQKGIADNLIDHFSLPDENEIKNAIFDLNQDSAPGPDGFTGTFYRAAWDIIKSNLVEAIHYCWKNNIIPSASKLVNEMVTKRRGGNLSLKLDISQAYHTMSWEFLYRAMKQFGFSAKFCNWILVLLKSSKISIMLNGGPIGFFGVGRGLKQGDPLSPILFTIEEDILSINIHHMILEKKIQPMVVRNSMHPSHLLFADDILLFCNGGMRNITNLRSLLVEYQDATGQVINAAKSKLFINGTSESRKRQFVDFFQMNLSTFPDRYLGVMLVQGRVKSCHLWHIVDYMHNRLVSWSGKFLNFQARLTLVNHVLCSIPIYNMSIYKWSRKIIDACERIIRNYLRFGNAEDQKYVTLK
ncbi:uncharacterized protein LOC113324886 [Papaver somniferum]|uniref:uncharacterized protein LOC113324886 n=1 Tax=Papaver somniferum TaxID=3469 RepID=UPI000E6F4DAA|nr:uncharacterized protein LOC113324886 [Papaver somniferum]